MVPPDKPRIDPLKTGRRRGWLSILAVLLVMLATAPFIIYWRIDANLFPSPEVSKVKKGMTKQEVLVILGDPNQRQGAEDCWNYDRFHRGDDRICIRFDPNGKVVAVSN